MFKSQKGFRIIATLIFVLFLGVSFLFYYLNQQPKTNDIPKKLNNAPQENIKKEVNKDLVTITLGKIDGSIKSLLGVNAGPYPSGDAGNADLSSQYKEIGVNAVRTHDFYGPFDMVSIYPDITADPLNSNSYNFIESDKAFNKIISNGIEPYLRVGDSYNEVRVPQTEKERKNLALAMVEVVKRYKDRGVKYVEIWNEPDNKQFWPKGFQSYLPFYYEVFTQIKKQYPDLKVGGPGFVVASYKIESARVNVSNFFSFCKEKGISPDFVSFHIYSNNPAEYSDAINFYRKEAAKYGFDKIELHMSEWNTEHKDDNIDMTLGNKAAPYLTAIWISQEQAQVDRAFIYRGNDTSAKLPSFYGIYYSDGKEKPSAKAFKLWSQMVKYKDKVSTIVSNYNDDKLWVLVGKNNNGNTAILLSNIGDKEIEYKIDGNNFNSVKLNQIYNKELTVKNINDLTLKIRPLEVQFVELSK